MKNFLVYSVFLLLLTGCDYEVTSSPSESDLSQVTMGDLSKASLSKGAFSTCVTIPGGELYTSDGRLISPGYDDWGYNYQAHMFKGLYCDAYRNAGWCQEYKDIQLSMKWNDAWLSNKDCDNDGKLDRNYGHDSYIGSGAWLTNHQSGEYESDGEIIKWNYFVKIVAVPTDAVAVPTDAEDDDGIWYTANGSEIGPVIWGQFAIIQQISNDPGANEHGVYYKSPVGPGFGKF